jgi:transposase
VASIKGTLSEDMIKVLEKLKPYRRLKVKEVTLDMAKNMEAAVKPVFTKAILVTDRYYVVKLAMEALQHIRLNKR